MTKKKGFAAMDPERQKEIASKGGKSLSLEVRKEIGRKGGLARAEKLRKNSLLLQQGQPQEITDIVVLNESADESPIFTQKEKKPRTVSIAQSSTVIA
ncbi:MAG: KGG domain-containing protein [Nitrososphaerales archaeon]